MSEQLQLRRGTQSQVQAFTGAQGEVVVDTTNNRLVVNDGATAGGAPAAKLSEVVTNARTSVSDAAYTVVTTDRLVAYTALTASRTVTLPASSAFPTGSRLLVIDESGNCSATKFITITRSGSDTINGQATAVLAAPYGFIALESNGAGGWFITDQEAAACGPTGSNITFGVAEVELTGLAGATVTATDLIPANCILFSVSAVVLTAITCSGGGTSFEVGDAGQTGDGGNSASRFGSALPFTAGTSNYGLIGPTAIYSACNVILQPNAGSFTAGAVRLSAHYMLCGPTLS